MVETSGIVHLSPRLDLAVQVPLFGAAAVLAGSRVAWATFRPSWPR